MKTSDIILCGPSYREMYAYGLLMLSQRSSFFPESQCVSPLNIGISLYNYIQCYF